MGHWDVGISYILNHATDQDSPCNVHTTIEGRSIEQCMADGYIVGIFKTDHIMI